VPLWADSTSLKLRSVGRSKSPIEETRASPRLSPPQGSFRDEVEASGRKTGGEGEEERGG